MVIKTTTGRADNNIMTENHFPLLFSLAVLLLTTLTAAQTLLHLG